MSNASRDLEKLITKIQKMLAPDSEVLHDIRLDGRQSGRKRQIDVLVRQKIGQYEIQIVIDCKDYARPVDVKGVEEFYGLLTDVGAHKGVLVCPRGFSVAAKTRAEGYQIDLYSPIDTDPHKWQAKVTIPALCDFRTAAISFEISVSSPVAFLIHHDFFSSNIVYDSDRNELGTTLDTAINKWNEGRFPTELGEYSDLRIFDVPEVMTDNGYGMITPVGLSASLDVKRELYYGQLPIRKFSGFKDEIAGEIITNAFTVGILDPKEIERDWLKVESEKDAPIKPVIKLLGIVLWVSQ